MNKIVFGIIILLSFSHSYGFEDERCLKNEFSTTIEKGIDPFGYLKESLTITKKKCDVIIELQKAKYIKSKWHIDICREPIHIKYGNNLQNVAKKNGEKCTGEKNDYCEEFDQVRTVLEDNGLIYGKGIREDLTSPHGKVYCTYLLLKQYLSNNIVFSYEKPVEIVLSGSTFMNGLEDKIQKSVTHKSRIDESDSNNEEKLYDF